MWAILLALAQSLAGSLGGNVGALILQLLNTADTAYQDKEAWAAWAGPWILWANAIADAGRDPTPEEDAAAVALATSVHANNQSLGAGGPPIALPSPPGVA